MYVDIYAVFKYISTVNENVRRFRQASDPIVMGIMRDTEVAKKSMEIVKETKDLAKRLVNRYHYISFVISRSAFKESSSEPIGQYSVPKNP